MIVDTHVHVYPEEIEKNWEKIAEREPYFSTLVQSKVHRWGTVDKLLHSMSEDGVDQAWICGFGFVDMGLCREVNDYVLEAAGNSPDKVLPMIVVPPSHKDAEQEIFRCAGKGAIAVGELFPGGQGWDISDSTKTEKIVGACEDTSLFLLIHTAEPVGHSYPGKGITGPKEAAAFCMNHPHIPVIFAHLGGGVWLYESMPEMRKCLQNAWYDMAAAPFLYDASVFAALAAMPHVFAKVFYGSDYPLLRVPRYKKLVEAVNPELSTEEKAALFGKNAQNFLQKILQ